MPTEVSAKNAKRILDTTVSYVLQVHQNEQGKPFHGSSFNVKSLYEFGTFALQMREPSQSYKVTVKRVNTTGSTIVWDRAAYVSEEDALKRGEYIRITYAKFIK